MQFSICLFQFKKEEVGEYWEVIVWSITTAPLAQYTKLLQQTNVVDLSGMPALGNILQTIAFQPNEESSDKCKQCFEDDGDSSAFFTQTFVVMGLTCEESYQKTVQSAICCQQEIVVKLVPERDNPKVINAIRLVVCVQDQSLPIGIYNSESDLCDPEM